MIISPPFLSRTDTAVYDEQCVRSVMSGGIWGSGGFPLGQAMVWHGGAHITAPNANEPVRAIADGIVIFRREGGTAEYDGQPHSTGCVVIRHTTEIGADPGTNGATAVEVTYYSIYQHLRKLDAALPALNQPIYRKDKLGLAGDIHGQPNRIHLEIIAGDADTQKLVGRKTAELPLNKDGRSNTVYGQLYVLLPAKSACHATQPGNAPLPAPSGDSGNTDLIIGIQYEQGHATLTTYQLTGEIVGSAPVETDAEYQLYAEANKRHSALSPNERANSSPSGWYELLRFGRNLGPDPLPAHAAHWRKVVLPGHPQGAWVNLNAAGTYKFSDADFPHWIGWKLIDDDTEDNNSQCNSALIDAMLSPAAQPKAAPAGPPSLIGPSTPPPQAPETAQTTPEQRAANRLQNLCKPDVQEKLAKTICKFPTEWAKNELRSRWAWIKAKGNPYMPFPLDDEEFEKVVTFGEKLCFWEELPQEDKDRLTFTHWHFHPREFIAHFRKCGWLSTNELRNVLGAAPTRGRERAGGLKNPLNEMLRRYGINRNPLRSSHFLAQVGHETGWWQYREELGNERYFRTMYEIITNVEAAEDYRSGLAQRLNLVRNSETEQQYASRRPGAVATKAQTMDNGVANNSRGGMEGDGARFKGRGFLQITGRRNYTSYGNYRGQNFTTDPNPILLSSNDFNACDASGFYWARERIDIEADAGSARRNVTRVGGLINRGNANRVPLHDNDRQSIFLTIWRKLNDQV